MGCFCKNEAFVNIVKAYQNCELICTEEGYFEVLCPPKVCVKQRLIEIDKDNFLFRVIIKLFNYEKICFENIHLINAITPRPKEIHVNRIDGLYNYSDGKLDVLFPVVNELSTATIDYFVSLDKCEKVDSSIYMKDDKQIDVDNGKLKKCITTLKL